MITNKKKRRTRNEKRKQRTTGWFAPVGPVYGLERAELHWIAEGGSRSVSLHVRHLCTEKKSEKYPVGCWVLRVTTYVTEERTSPFDPVA